MLIFYQVNVLLHITLIRSTERSTITEARQQFIPRNPHGEENPAELLYYRFDQVQCQDEDLSPIRIYPTDIEPSINQQINPPCLSSLSVQSPRKIAQCMRDSKVSE